jgi:hypothetical protein
MARDASGAAAAARPERGRWPPRSRMYCDFDAWTGANVREFKSQSVKFSMPSPTDPSKQTRVLVSLAHVVRMVPYYFVDSGGTRMITTVEGDEKAAPRGLKRSFMVYDALGGQYDSGSASSSGQALLERMWEESS